MSLEISLAALSIFCKEVLPETLSCAAGVHHERSIMKAPQGAQMLPQPIAAPFV